MNNKVKNLNYVRFDVGNYLHVCHRNTIEKFGDSVLAKYISPNFDRRNSESEFIVIDRDGKHFSSILNYMRDQGSLNFNNLSENDVIDIKREADFYCLESLVELCQRQLDLYELERRRAASEKDKRKETFNIPSARKLVIIFGYESLEKALITSQKPTLVINYQVIRAFRIDHWFAELINYCNYDDYNVYGFSSTESKEYLDRRRSEQYSRLIVNRGPPPVDEPGGILSESIVCFYRAGASSCSVSLKAPPEEEFRLKRASYKCKIYKLWFLVQNNYPNKRNKMTG